MRAVLVRPPAPGVEIGEVPAPTLGAGQVLVDVLECGVCGTDHDIVEGKYGRAPAGSPFLVLGHENLGRVREVASGSGTFVPRDLVVATVRRGCGRCRFCRTNQSDFCETGEFTERGIGGAHGFMADQYVDLPEYLVKVPPALGSCAVLLEPLSVVEKAIFQGQRVLDRKEPTRGEPRTATPTALVAGTGAVGMLSALVLAIRGYRVTAIDRHGEETLNARILARIGAGHVNVAAGFSALGEARFDLVIEATGSVSVDFSLLDRLGANGVVVLTGIPDAAEPPATVPAGHLFRDIVLGNQAIVGSVNANRTYFESGLRDMTVASERWPGVLDTMITARRPIEQCRDVLAGRTGGGVKTVLTVRSAQDTGSG